MNQRFAGPGCLFAFLVAGAFAVAAEPASVSTAEFAKQSNNPLARVINLALTDNANFEKGPYERTQNACTLSATIPFDLPGNWNLFTITSLPLISQPVGATDRVNGMGDLGLTALFAPPATASGWTFGFGPSFVFPTATDETLGQGSWEIGPALAAVYRHRTWIAGVLLYQNWSVVGGNTQQGVSRLTVSPFFTYYVNKGWYFISAPQLSADWAQEPPRTWTVPLGGGFGHIVRRGKHAFNFTAQAYVYVVRPENAAKWQFRLTTSWVFPRR
jgi:hypothetical protein